MPPTSAPAALAPAPRRVRSLRTHITWTLGGFAVLLSISLCIAFGEWLKHRLQQSASQNLTQVARHAELMLRNELQTQVARVTSLANSAELWKDGLHSSRVTDTLQRAQIVQPYNVWIGVTDAYGTVQSATQGLLQGRNVADRPWFRHALLGTYVGDVHPAVKLAEVLPNPSGEPLRLLDFAAPITTPAGTVRGIVGLHSNWQWVQEALHNLLPTDDTQALELLIFDSQGALLHQPMAPSTAPTPPPLHLPFAPATRDATSSALTSVAQWADAAEPFLTSAVRLQMTPHDLGWWIVARQPVRTAYAEARHAVWLAAGVALLAGVLAVLVAWLLARHVSRDLRTLAHAAQQLPTEGSDHPIPLLDSNREVQQLSQALAHTTERLLRAHHTMKQQVEERTLALRNANTELERLARTDPLTGLLNRRGFEYQVTPLVSLARRSERPLSVVTLDIDHFKQVNDTYGHDVGDQVLQLVAELLQERLRESDILARFGGEEFVVLLPDTALATAQTMTEQVLQFIAETPFAKVGHITLSAGVSHLHADDYSDTITDMLQRSDAALYAAKHSGRNRVVVSAVSPTTA